MKVRCTEVHDYDSYKSYLLVAPEMQFRIISTSGETYELNQEYELTIAPPGPGEDK